MLSGVDRAEALWKRWAERGSATFGGSAQTHPDRATIADAALVAGGAMLGDAWRIIGR